MTPLDLFLQMPFAARQAIAAAAGARNRALRYGRTYQRVLALLAESEGWLPEKHRELQAALLERLLIEARARCPHYRRSLARLSPAELAAAARAVDLSPLPTVDKDALRKRPREFLNDGRSTVAVTSTSGSTGSPLRACYDLESLQTTFALLHGHWRWMGLAGWPRTARLGGRQLLPTAQSKPPFWLANPAERVLLVSTYHLRADLAPAIWQRLRRYRPELIEGYPSALEQLAELAPAKAPLESLRAVRTSAETLTPASRHKIEDKLGVRVFDYYSASEGLPLVQQCDAGTYHVRPESGIVEILDGAGRAVPPGEAGELVVTSFRQWKMPLIRYRTGDLAVAPKAPEPCSCGRSLPRLEKILGRSEDLVVTADGRAIGMFAYRTLKPIGGLAEAQIVQKKLDEFRVTAVPAEGADAEEVKRQIGFSFERVLGSRPQVEVDFVEQVPRGAGGKFRAVVRDFDSPAEIRR